MSSFRKNTNFNKKINNGVTFGIPSLDDIIGERIEYGSMILIKEDEYSKYYVFLGSVFMSECINTGMEVMCFSKDMVDICIPDVKKEKEEEEKSEKMVFAWKYTHLKLDKQKVKYDLTRKMDLSDKKNCKIYFDVNLEIKKIKEILEECKENSIIFFYSFLSPLWFYYNKIKEKEIYEFLFFVRKICKKKKCISFFSVPVFFNTNIYFNLYFDVVISLKSFFIENGGVLLEFEKFCFKEHVMESLKYSVSIKGGGVVVDKIVLPPEEIEDKRECVKGCIDKF